MSAAVRLEIDKVPVVADVGEPQAVRTRIRLVRKAVCAARHGKKLPQHSEPSPLYTGAISKNRPDTPGVNESIRESGCIQNTCRHGHRSFEKNTNFPYHPLFNDALARRVRSRLTLSRARIPNYNRMVDGTKEYDENYTRMVDGLPNRCSVLQKGRLARSVPSVATTRWTLKMSLRRFAICPGRRLSATRACRLDPFAPAAPCVECDFEDGPGRTTDGRRGRDVSRFKTIQCRAESGAFLLESAAACHRIERSRCQGYRSPEPFEVYRTQLEKGFSADEQIEFFDRVS